MKTVQVTSRIAGLALAVMPLAFASRAQAAPNAAKWPQKIARTGKARCANPRGMKLKVGAFFKVTNSDDGFADHTVESYGELLFNNWTVWYVDRKDAVDQRKNNSFNAGEFTFKVLFNDQKTWMMGMSGFVSDRDKGAFNNDDAMWNPLRLRLIIDLKNIYESGGGGRNGFYFWKGDRNRESADLTLVVSKVGDIY